MHALTLVLAAAVAGGAPQGNAEPPSPPGLVWIEGGKTRIGSTVRAVEDIGAKNEVLFPSLVCETPEHEVVLDDFFLMVSEVTNEQYAAFVRATGARPPQSWAEQALRDASELYVEELDRKAAESQVAGTPPPPRTPFERGRWWAEHWREAHWEVPAGCETCPVVYVRSTDAEAYARWAGLRLMSELEYQRAARGRTGSLFPWGDLWDERRAVTQALSTNQPLPVGSAPEGASPRGVYDLAGNCWEWTSSPFLPFPGYADLQIVIGFGQKQHKVDGLTRWDAEQRVSVGGCFQTGLLEARATTRRPTDREQATDSLGFRCAASVRRGVDLARAILRDDLPSERWPRGLAFDASDVVLADRWSSEPGTARVPRYAVIRAYDHILFLPSRGYDATTVKSLRERSTREPVALGLVSTTRKIAEPALEPGVYLLRFQAGNPKAALDVSESAAPIPPGLDPRVDQIRFERMDGSIAVAVAAPTLEYVHPTDAHIGLAPSEDGARVLVSLHVHAWAKIPAKAFAFSFELALDPAEAGGDWRQ